MAQQQELTESFRSSTNTHTHWSLRIELGAAPALVLGQALGRQRDVFKLHEMNQLKSLTLSAYDVIDTFLAAPSSVAIHLPATAYTTIWYCLLVLCKLSLLFHPCEHQAIGVYKKIIHSKGASIVRRFEELALEDDVWTSSKKVIGNMLVWLEKTNREPRPSSASSDALQTCGGNDEVPQPSVPGISRPQGEDLDLQPVWPETYPSEHVAPLEFQFQHVDALDATLWQQMLDSFTWFAPVAENGVNSDQHRT